MATKRELERHQQAQQDQLGGYHQTQGGMCPGPGVCRQQWNGKKGAWHKGKISRNLETRKSEGEGGAKRIFKLIQ